jgi:hypothetical protein
MVIWKIKGSSFSAVAGIYSEEPSWAPRTR